MWLINYISYTWVLADVHSMMVRSHGEYSRHRIVQELTAAMAAIYRIGSAVHVFTRPNKMVHRLLLPPLLVIGNKYKRNYHSMANWICTYPHNVYFNPIKGQSRHGRPHSGQYKTEKRKTIISPLCPNAFPPRGSKNADNLSSQLHRVHLDSPFQHHANA